MTSLYFSNKPNQLNRDLITYLDSNIKSIVKMGLYIKFVVASPQDSEYYSKQGIVNFPTLIHNKQMVVGVDKIKGFFNNYYQMYKKKQMERTESDGVNDYWNSILAKGDDDENEDDAVEAMKNQAQKAVQERQAKLSKLTPGRNKPARPTYQPPAPAPTNNKSSRGRNLEPNTLDVIKGMSSSGQEAVDDELMAKFFENQLETDI